MRGCIRFLFATAVYVLALASLAAQSKDKKNSDPAAGRDVGGGINFYFLEREIALGKQ